MFGVYVHWPFCLSKCIYCDFNSNVIQQKDVNNPELQKKYCECCKKQIQYFSKKIQHNKYQRKVSSIYFGGGTPSLLSPFTVSNIIKEIINLLPLEENCEITLEANPTSFELEKFYHFHEIGINRISLGVQSFDDNELSWLGRKHTSIQAISAIKEIKNIFPYWNFDLIYGLPRQSINKWLEELKIAFSLDPQHLSLYTLIIDKNTPLGKMVQTGNIVAKTNDEMANFYNATNKFISNIEKNKKIKQYEISNYAIPSFESKHNCCYWDSYDYIGIGPMAHGRLTYNDEKKYEIICHNNIQKWFEDLEKKQNGLEIERSLSKQELVEEILLMGLRTTNGVNVKDIYKRFSIDITKYIDNNNVYALEKQNFLHFSNQVLKLTYSGAKILDTILLKILK